MRRATTLLLLLLLAACGSPNVDTPVPAPSTSTTGTEQPSAGPVTGGPATSDPIITLDRSPCFGTCPDYHLAIWADGTVQFAGRQYVEATGIHTATISPEQVATLVTAFDDLGYMDLHDEYMNMDATDSPYVTTAFTQTGTTKSIQHYHGDMSAPKGLTELENTIDTVVNTQQWVGSGVPLNPLPELEPSSSNQPIITLEREACFGFCPVYHLAIWADGTVQFEGLQYVDAPGLHATNIAPEKVQELVGAFNDLGYMDLNDEYTAMTVTDMPYINTAFTQDGTTKSIRHYHGDDSAPEGLTTLENTIDTVVNTRQWIGNGGQK